VSFSPGVNTNEKDPFDSDSGEEDTAKSMKMKKVTTTVQRK
jgi:hypothetical protein